MKYKNLNTRFKTKKMKYLNINYNQMIMTENRINMKKLLRKKGK